MFKGMYGLILIVTFCLFISGCAALLETALSAAAGYGIYQATKKR